MDGYHRIGLGFGHDDVAYTRNPLCHMVRERGSQPRTAYTCRWGPV